MPTWRERFFQEVLHEYHGESDRAAAVLAAAFLDTALVDRLTAFLVDDPVSAALLNRIQSFKLRVDLAFSLGFLDADTRADLLAINSIRNKFAHQHGVKSFEDAKVKEKCAELRFTKLLYDFGLENEESLGKPRIQYLFTVAFSVLIIDGYFHDVDRRTIPDLSEREKLIDQD